MGESVLEWPSVPAEARQEAACPVLGTFYKARAATELEAQDHSRQSFQMQVLRDIGAITCAPKTEALVLGLSFLIGRVVLQSYLSGQLK